MPNLSPVCVQLNSQFARLNTLISEYNKTMSENQPSSFAYKDAQAGLTAATSELAGLRQQWLANGCNQIVLPKPKKPVIRILMVTDGSGGHWASFGPGDPDKNPATGDNYFGLSEVIRTLTDTSTLSVNIQLTKAHRDTDPLMSVAYGANFNLLSPADQALFKPDYSGPQNPFPGFDKLDALVGGLINAFDEIWLFGVGTLYETAALTPAEIQAIVKFMDAGGGVFATGDHADLGFPLNGQIPRVRSMRMWYYNAAGQPNPDGGPTAPPPIDTQVGGAITYRNDTTQPGHNDPAVGTVLFDNQSDDIPQPITPILFRHWTAYPFHFYFVHHPLLDYPNGVIDVLPDHMHEGEIIDPRNYNFKPITVNGQPYVEYPADAYGYTVYPAIVATGHALPNINDSTEGAHTGDSMPGGPNPNQSRTFGVVGAYDGHQTKNAIGRIAVDSTWHHFFDINLVGDPVAPGPKTQGFEASPSGMAALDKIQTYYRNIVVWLAPAKYQQFFFARAAYGLAHTQPLNMVRSGIPSYNHKQLLQIGGLASTALARWAPLSTQIDWLHAHLRYMEVDNLLDSSLWQTQGGSAMPQQKSVDYRSILVAALGGAVIEIGQKFQADENEEANALLKRLVETAHAGVKVGLHALANNLKSEATTLSDFAAKLTKTPHK